MEADQQKLKQATGFPVANFSLAAEVTPDAVLFPRILYNTPVLGEWLQLWGACEVSIAHRGRVWRPADFAQRSAERRWPEVHLTWSDHAFPWRVHITAFAPVIAGNIASTALPAIMLEFRFEGPAMDEATFHIDLTPSGPFSQPQASRQASSVLHAASSFGVGWSSLAADDRDSFSVDSSRNALQSRLTARVGPGRVVRACILVWDERSLAGASHKSCVDLFNAVRDQWAVLASATASFSASLPCCGDSIIDDGLRWYMLCAVALTRTLRDGTLLTLGYRELTQRDSFWASIVHLHYWPQAERRMIQESADAVRDNGKLPTTILPIIEREDDIDINEYFLLRVARYLDHTGDLAFVRDIWPACKRALEYLAGRCPTGSALPDQRSTWADWKDVPGVAGRQYAPHFCLLYLGALQEIGRVAASLGDQPCADRCRRLYAAAYEQVNRSTEAGGLWNGRYYVTRWRDGRDDQRVLEDQLVAGLWGVIPPERLASILLALKPNEKPWGVRETFPYWPGEQFGYAEGDYHNGAVWPFLNSIDAAVRIRHRYREDGLRILRSIAQWDLFQFGDYMPHECLHGETGQNTRFCIQGWNAAYLLPVLELARSAGTRALSQGTV